MKIQRKKRTNYKKLAIIISLLVALTAAGLYFAYAKSQKETNNTNNTTASSKIEKTTNKPEKSSTTEESDSSTSATDTAGEPARETQKEPIQSYEGPAANEAPTLTGAITYSSAVEGNLIIRTVINQAVGGGTCELTLSNGSKTVTETSGITANPSSSSCEGFTVPTSKLGSGEWNISIKTTSGDRQGTLAGKVRL